MTFKEWFENSNLTPVALGRITGLDRSTIVGILNGKKPYRPTITKLVISTRNMKNPIKRAMFD